MKILLVGEYSSLHKNLKDGLLELGHEVTIAADSCGWMEIKPDIDFSSNRKGLMGKIESFVFKPLKALPSLRGFDVVQFISPLVLHPKTLTLVKYFYGQLISNNQRSFLLAAGDDSYFATSGIYQMSYSPWEDAGLYDGFTPDVWRNKRVIAWNEQLVELVDGIIPVMYDYACGYRVKKVNSLLPTIPLPMNLSKIQYKENRIANKIVFFHGLNRYGFKGTHYIEKAFENVSKKYPNDVECIIKGQLPLEKYLKLISTVNISIDQTSSYSYGMNAIYALSMGHVVMSGCEKECLQEFGINESPVINIRPSIKDVIDKMECILDKRKDISEWGQRSRLYSESLHDHVKVAQKYLDTWCC
jgi:hypothetical protein